jgi:hypothetical protein
METNKSVRTLPSPTPPIRCKHWRLRRSIRFGARRRFASWKQRNGRPGARCNLQVLSCIHLGNYRARCSVQPGCQSSHLRPAWERCIAPRYCTQGSFPISRETVSTFQHSPRPNCVHSQRWKLSATVGLRGCWPNASKVFIGLHRDGLTGCPQANLSRGGLRTLAEDFRIKKYTLFYCATGCSTATFAMDRLQCLYFYP